MSISVPKSPYYRTGYPRGGRRGRGVSPLRPANGLRSVAWLFSVVLMLLVSVVAMSGMIVTGYWFLAPLPLAIGGTSVPLLLLVLGDDFLDKNFRPLLARLLTLRRTKATAATTPRRATWRESH